MLLDNITNFAIWESSANAIYESSGNKNFLGRSEGLPLVV